MANPGKPQKKTQRNVQKTAQKTVQQASQRTSNISRRRLLSKWVLGGSAVVGTSTLSSLLKGCMPDFAALDRFSGSANSATTSGTANNIDPTAASSTDQANDIKVGILHSLSGTMALSETPIVDALLMAIDEINAAGGVLGKPLIPIQEDGASDWPTYAEKAEKLIDQHNVAVIFGGLTSASRKAILPVVKAKNRLLWYPGAYEGQECSQNIFYAGSTANQQVEPAVNWMLGNRGKSFFLVSSNARTTHDIVKAQLKARGGKVAGEAYVPLINGINADMTPVVKDIKNALPEGGIIFNALVGNHNRAFFKELKSAGLPAHKYLVMSVRISEEEIFQIGPEFVDGHYAAWSYFQTIDSAENKQWVSDFQNQYGSDRVVGDPMATAYTMVYLWAQAVEKAKSIDTTDVRTATYGQSFKGPQGLVTMQTNHHLSKTVRIGKVLDNGQFEILMTQDKAIAPNPWSQYIASGKGFACDWSDPNKKGKYNVEAAENEV